MTLAKTRITGGFLLPDGKPPVNGQAEFLLSSAEAAAGAGILRRLVVPLDAAGVPVEPDFGLWPNTDGVRGTYYRVVLLHDVPRRLGGTEQAVTPFPNIQVSAAETDWEALFNNPVPDTPGWNVNLDPEEYAALLASNAAAVAAEAVATTASGAAVAAAALTAADRVQTAADRVQTTADRVQTTADRVQTGLDRTAAEAARDAASLGANVYADTAAGLAAVGLGGQFQVVVGTDLVRYREDAGPVAVEVSRMPTTAAVKPLQDIVTGPFASADYQFAVVGGTGLPLFAIDGRGELRATLADMPGSATLSDEFAYMERAQNGQIIAGLRWNGTEYRPPVGLPLLDMLWAETDSAGNVVRGERLDGSFQSGPEYETPVAYPLLDLAWAETDGAGTILRAERFDGTYQLEPEAAAPVTYALLDDAWAETDQNGMALRRRRLDGTFAIGPELAGEWQAFLRDGDIWLVSPILPAFRFSHDGAAGVVRYHAPRVEGLALHYVVETVATGAMRPVRIVLGGAVTVAAGTTAIEGWSALGQSNVVGASTGTTVISRPAPSPRVLMPNGGVRTTGTLQWTTEVLPEHRVRDILPAEETNIGGWAETPMTQFGVGALPMIGATESLLVSNHGIGSTTFAQTAPGSVPYANLLLTMERMRLAAHLAGIDYRFGGVIHDQGEGNMTDALSQTRVDNLLALRTALAADALRITGDVTAPLISHAQTSNPTMYAYTLMRPVMTGQLRAALENPTLIVCPGPKYHHTYTDGTHLNSLGQARMGREHARAIRRRRAGLDALPLHVTSAVRVGTAVTITFRVPDDTTWEVNTTLVTDPGNWGVTWHDSTNSSTVASVGNPSPGVVVATLSGVPSGTSPQIGIAATGTSGAGAGPTSGMRSNFCAVTGDSYHDGAAIRLWAAHQLINVT